MLWERRRRHAAEYFPADAAPAKLVSIILVLAQEFDVHFERRLGKDDILDVGKRD